MMIPTMMLSAVALALLTLFVYLMLTILGVGAKASGKLSDDYSKNKSGTPPPDGLANWGRNLTNLMELPVLFYVLVAFQAINPETITELQTMLAFAFVVSRYLHLDPCDDQQRAPALSGAQGRLCDSSDHVGAFWHGTDGGRLSSSPT